MLPRPAFPAWLCLGVLGMRANGSAQQPVFEPFQIYSAGGTPQAVGITELDGDGHLDLLVASGSSVRILLGDGAGGFGLRTGVHVECALAPLLMGDLNGDGYQDLVICRSVLLGGGAGALAPPTAFAPGHPGTAAALDDFDQDGALDLVTAGAGAIFFLPGDGAGAFGSPASVTSASTAEIAAGDVSRDGSPDLVFCEPNPSFVTGSVSSLAGDGLGGFAPASSFALATGTGFPADLILAPLNGDGALDVASLWTNEKFSTVDVRLGDGTGGFAYADSMTGPKAQGIAAADLNGDFDRDLVLAIHAYSFGFPIDEVEIFRGTGNGGFDSSLSVALPYWPTRPALGDLDGNGRIDVVTTALTSTYVVVLENVTPLPAGLSTYGASTHGCLGTHGIAASGSASVGNSSFRLTLTNAPPDAASLVIVGDAQGTGLDPFGLGIQLNVDLLGSSALFALDSIADSAGYASAAAPIPNAPGLAGQSLYACGIFFWSFACTLPSFASLSSSNGLAISIIP